MSEPRPKGRPPGRKYKKVLINLTEEQIQWCSKLAGGKSRAIRALITKEMYKENNNNEKILTD